MTEESPPEGTERSVDEASLQMLDRAKEEGLQTAWDRGEDMDPRCKFGSQGVCCRICNMGPCRIVPGKTDVGVCGADVDTIVARNLVRMIAAGAAAHSDHGRDVAHTLFQAATEEESDYQVLDSAKLEEVARDYGIDLEGREESEIARAVSEEALSEFGQQGGELMLSRRAPQERINTWREEGLIPRGIDREIVEIMHRTHMGTDAAYKNLINQGMRCALGDGWGGSMIATELQDVLFETPTPLRAEINLGVLEEDSVNLVVHGHEPTLSEMIAEAARDPEMLELAEEKGAEGINVSGICCTANEILMRHGIPIAGNFLQQELALATGAVDLMMVDVQCIMPALSSLSDRFHTQLITTSPKAKIPGVDHVQFEEQEALNMAKDVIRRAVENYPNRIGEEDIPDETMDLIGGFTSESVSNFLGGTYRSTYRPLNDAIIDGRLRGAAGVVGCNNPKVCHDYGHTEMAKHLIKNDVLVVTTGCSAIADGKQGLMKPEVAFEEAGEGLQEICEAVGLPPVLHLGSCVDNSRILNLLTNVVNEGGLGEDISDLPVAGAAPEWMSEKAVSIGFYFVASGVFTVLGKPFPVQGSEKVTEYLTDGLEERVGATFAFEEDPVEAADLMLEHIQEKREALGLKQVMYASK